MVDLGDTTIEFNEEKGIMKISGISMMEDSLEFYSEIKKKLMTIYQVQLPSLL